MLSITRTILGPLAIGDFRTKREEPLDVINPAWSLGNEPPLDLVQDMSAIIENLLTLYEDVLSDGILRLAPASPFTIVEIPEAERNLEMPIRLVPSLKTPLSSE